MIRRVLSVAMVATLMLAAGVVSRAVALDEDRAAAIAELRSLAQSTRTAEMRTDHLEGSIAIAEKDTAARAAVLEVRPAFVVEIAALREAMEGADGKIDTSAHRAAAMSAQASVLAERKDPATVIAATATVNSLIDRVGQDVGSGEAAHGSEVPTR